MYYRLILFSSTLILLFCFNSMQSQEIKHDGVRPQHENDSHVSTELLNGKVPSTQGVYWSYDTVTTYSETDQLLRQYIRTYDERRNILTDLELRRQNDIWVKYESTTTTYDENNHPTLVLRESRLSNGSYNNWRTTNKYDAAGNNIYQLVEQSSSNNEKWSPSSVRQWEYDENRNVIREFETIYSGKTAESTRTTRTFNSGNKVLTEIVAEPFRQQNGDTAWINTKRLTITYNGSDLVLSTVYEEHVGDISKDIREVQSTFRYVYDANDNIIRSTHEAWSTNFNILYLASEINYQYQNDGNGRTVTKITQNWTPTLTSSYATRFSSEITSYNSAKQVIRVERGSKKDSLGEWQTTSIASYTYNPHSTVIVNENPSTDKKSRTAYLRNDDDFYIGTVEESWTEGKFQEVRKGTYQTDANGNTVHGESFAMVSGSWAKQGINSGVAALNVYANGKIILDLYALTGDPAQRFEAHFVTINPPVGIKQAEKSESVLYPNPTTDAFSVRTGTAVINHAWLYNSMGVLMQEQSPVTPGFITFSTTGYPPGVYYQRIDTENGAPIFCRVVKQ